MTHEYSYEKVAENRQQAYNIQFKNTRLWFPKSVVRLDQAKKRISIPVWFVEKNKLTMLSDYIVL